MQIEEMRREVCVRRRKDLAEIWRIVQNGQEGKGGKYMGGY